MKKFLACLCLTVSFTSFATNFNLENISSVHSSTSFSTYSDLKNLDSFANFAKGLDLKNPSSFNRFPIKLEPKKITSIDYSTTSTDLTKLEPKEITSILCGGKLKSFLGVDIPSNEILCNIEQFCNLEELKLDHSTSNSSFDKLSGPIPTSFGNLIQLTTLNLSANELTGPIPASIGDLSNLQHLNLSCNGLSGPIPTSFGNLIQLKTLNLSINKLTGPIPKLIEDLFNLEYLNLSRNGLSGPIPTSLKKLTQLITLSLSVNELTGPIPDSIGQLTKLDIIDLSKNNLTGFIPASIGDLSNLGCLQLSNNNLTGAIPDGIGQLTELKIINLSHNVFTAMPSSIFNLKKDTLTINLRHNKISHVIQQEENQPTMSFKGIYVGLGGEDSIGIMNSLIYLNKIKRSNPTQYMQRGQRRHPIIAHFSQVQGTQLEEFEKLNLSLGTNLVLTRPIDRDTVDRHAHRPSLLPRVSYSKAIKEVLTIIQQGQPLSRPIKSARK